MPKLWKGTNLFPSGSARFGDNANYTDFTNKGYMTAASTARTYKEIWFPATVLHGGQPVGDSACTHATTGSVLYSTGAGASGGRFYIPTISPCGTACDMQINILFPAPTDIDITSTASPIIVVEHVLTAAFATAGSGIGYRLNYNYVTNGSSTTTGSMTQTIVAAGACGNGARVSGSLGELPAPAASGQWIHLALRQLTGACGAAANADVVGVRFRYFSNKLGAQTT